MYVVDGAEAVRGVCLQVGPVAVFGRFVELWVVRNGTVRVVKEIAYVVVLTD